MNAEVILACRSIEKANQARDSIIESTKCSSTKVRVIKLDLCSFSSVRQFVDEFRRLELPLHGLINNAGIMMATKELTPVRYHDHVICYMSTSSYFYYMAMFFMCVDRMDWRQ
jgi:short-subunit dehydrogenase